jgi:hypothetical protein
MRRLSAFVKANWNWLSEATSLGVFLLCSLIAATIVWWWWPCEIALRYGGLVLEIYGVFTVIWDIGETRERFKLPGFIPSVKQWWARRPKWQQPTVVTLDRGQATAGSATPSPYVTAGEDDPVKLRIAALETNLKLLDGLFRSEMLATKKKLHEVSDLLNKERDQRLKKYDELFNTIKEQETGGLHISVMGSIGIFFGAIMATVPDKILYYLSVSPTGPCS